MIALPIERVARLIRGATEVERGANVISPLRLPRWTRAQQADRWIEFWSAQTVGVRLVTLTTARRVLLEVSVTRLVPLDATEPPFPCVIVATIGGVEVSRREIVSGPTILTHPDRTWSKIDGPRSLIELTLPEADGEREVTIWFPHNGAAVIHGVSADAPLEEPARSTQPRWLHHGSSVSHCIEAESPLGPWPQQAARTLNLELTNLAIAGNAQLDPFVARTIAAEPADIITLKLGVNVVNADSMRRRAFIPALHGFLDLIREGHPFTPIVVLTPIVSPSIEDTPGPSRKLADGRFYGTEREVADGDGTLTLRIVRMLVTAAVEERAQTDLFLWGSDGLELFSQTDAALLWDGLHPSQAGYDLIARRFVAQVRDGSSALSEAFSRIVVAPDTT
jgi:lysophospholipase L1-like esterase